MSADGEGAIGTSHTTCTCSVLKSFSGCDVLVATQSHCMRRTCLECGEGKAHGSGAEAHRG